MLQRMKQSLARLSAVFCLLLAGFADVGTAHAELDKQQAVVDKAKLAVEALAAQTDMGQFRRLLAVSRGVVVIPQFLKAGFIVGGAGGHGVLLARNDAGEWSSPVFYTIGEVSIGLQIGAQSKELILVIMTEQGLDAILENQVQLGAGVSAAVGPVGKDLGASTTTNLDADIFSFANTAGLFIGASVEGSILDAKEDWNRAYYGKSLSVKEIVKDRLADKSESQDLKDALKAAEAP